MRPTDKKGTSCTSCIAALSKNTSDWFIHRSKSKYHAPSAIWKLILITWYNTKASWLTSHSLQLKIIGKNTYSIQLYTPKSIKSGHNRVSKRGCNNSGSIRAGSWISPVRSVACVPRQAHMREQVLAAWDWLLRVSQRAELHLKHHKPTLLTPMSPGSRICTDCPGMLVEVVRGWHL